MIEIDEDDPIYQAIDKGGGQTCDIAGVIRELAAAGYVITRGWQPIETAPKDGTYILVCKPGMDQPWVASWRDGKRKQFWQNSFAFLGWTPTLWQPLPIPPVKP